MLKKRLTHSKHTQGFDLYTWNLRMAIIIASNANSLILIWWCKKILTFWTTFFSNTTHTLQHTYCVNMCITNVWPRPREEEIGVNEQYRLTLMGKSNRDTKLKLNKTPDSCWKRDNVRGLLNMLLQFIRTENDVLLHQKLSDIAASNSHHLTKILGSDSLGNTNGIWKPIYGNCLMHNTYLMNVR